MLTFLDGGQRTELASADLWICILSNTSASSAVVPVALVPSGVELSVLIDMKGDVENIGVVVKRFLNTVAYES
jgi:hypothetical protein